MTEMQVNTTRCLYETNNHFEWPNVYNSKHDVGELREPGFEQRRPKITKITHTKMESK